jgi:hypothetical protein
MKSKWIIFIFMTIKHVGSTCKNSVLLYDIFDTGVWHLVFTGVSYIKWIIIMQIFMTIKHVGSTREPRLQTPVSKISYKLQDHEPRLQTPVSKISYKLQDREPRLQTPVSKISYKF